MPNSADYDYVYLFANENWQDIEEAMLQDEYDRLMEDTPIKSLYKDDDAWNYDNCCCDHCNDRWGSVRIGTQKEWKIDWYQSYDKDSKRRKLK